jgi:hypothetical protein
MHTPASHRARVIAAPSAPTEPVPDTPVAQLSRQAALFKRLLEHSAGADAPAPWDDESPAAVAPGAAATETACPLAIMERRQNENHGEEGRDENERGEAGVTPDMPAEARTPESATVRAVTAIEAPAHATNGMHRLVESIVAEVAGFCANPVVLESGNWHITISLDPTLLPGCTLSVALSHFQLTLRFETEQPQSRQLISQHAATLRTSLEHVLQTRLDGSRSIEIIVT